MWSTSIVWRIFSILNVLFAYVLTKSISSNDLLSLPDISRRSDAAKGQDYEDFYKDYEENRGKEHRTHDGYEYDENELSLKDNEIEDEINNDVMLKVDKDLFQKDNDLNMKKTTEDYDHKEVEKGTETTNEYFYDYSIEKETAVKISTEDYNKEKEVVTKAITENYDYNIEEKVTTTTQSYENVMLSTTEEEYKIEKKTENNAGKKSDVNNEHRLVITHGDAWPMERTTESVKDNNDNHVYIPDVHERTITEPRKKSFWKRVKSWFSSAWGRVRSWFG